MAGLVRLFETRGPQHIDKFPVAASQTFVKGDFLTFNGSGQLQLAVAAGSNVGSGALIVGQANENALDDYGNLKQSVGVIIAQPGTQFKLPLYNATPSSAVFNTNELGVKYELHNLSSGGFAVDNGSTTNVAVTIVGIAAEDYPGWLHGTTGAGSIEYPAVWVEVRAAFSALTGAR